MGYSIVNILGGLLIVTSTMVVISKNIKHSIRWYAVQSLILVGLLATLGNVTGASDLTPVAEQLEMMQKVLPDVKKVGLLYCTAESNSDVQIKAAKKELDKLGLEYTDFTVCRH